MIKNIVFDMGQVLIRWKPEYYLAQGQFSEEEKAMLLKEVFRSVEWVQLDRGCISLEEAAAKMLEEQLRRKEQGAKYCNCEAHIAAGELLEKFGRIEL